MSKRARSGKEQREHDRKVRGIAQELKRKGYKVEADVKGFPQPETIGYKNPKRPDIHATGHGWEKIIEVETSSSAHTKRTREQNKKFKSWAQRKSNRIYELEMA